MRTLLKNLWKPREGITIEDMGDELLLFRFYHSHDLCLRVDGGPWSFDQNLLVLHVLQLVEDLIKVPLLEASFGCTSTGLQWSFTPRLWAKLSETF
ncbi:hypothetical protein LINGRAHAP2_LOCUS7988 [Linum grandiflorum]